MKDSFVLVTLCESKRYYVIHSTYGKLPRLIRYANLQEPSETLWRSNFVDSKTFVKEAENRNRALYKELNVEDSFMSYKTEDSDKVRKMVHMRLKQGLYNELRVAEVSAAWIPNSPLKAQHL